MKRYFAVLLALLLLCAAAPLALATEMYDTYGDMDDWDDATWDLSDGWSEEEWQDYWLGAEEVYEQERSAEANAKRQALGLPNQEGVNVKLNDSYLSFANAWPVLEDRILYLPLRDFLAACGIEAQISYDAATGVAHAVLADGRELTATLGSDELLAKDADSEEYEIYAYEPPKMINGIFYIQQGDLCDFLGFDSRWEWDNEILYIVDSEALIALLNRDFTIYNRLFSLPYLNRDMQQTYRVSGGLDFNAALYGDAKDDKVQAVIEYDGLIQGLNADISYAVKLDFDQIKDTLLSGLDADAMLFLRAISAGQARVIVNAKEDAFYLQSNLLPLLDKRLNNKDWLKLDEMMSAMSLADLSYTFMDQLAGMSIGRMIYSSAYNSYSYVGRDIYANALAQAKLWQSLIGDANFKQENRGGYTVYTLKADQKKLQKALDESGVDWPGSNIFGSLFSFYGYYDEEAVKLDHTVTFREKSGQITDLQMDISVQTSGYLPVGYSASLEYGGNSVKANFEMKGRYGGKLGLDFYQQLLPVNDTPAGAPPAGSKIVTEVDLDSQKLFW